MKWLNIGPATKGEKKATRKSSPDQKGSLNRAATGLDFRAMKTEPKGPKQRLA